MLALLRTFSWQELLHHPWRSVVTLLAVASGVALAFAVHLINASAISEFSSAARELSGQPDLVIRGVQAGFDESVLAQVAKHPEVALVSPVLELSTYMLSPDRSRRVAVQVIGVDPLAAASITPGLIAQPFAGQSRLVLFSPDSAFLNPAAFELLGLGVNAAQNLQESDRPMLYLQSGLELKSVVVRGSVGTVAEAASAGAPAQSAAGRSPLALIVMDVAAMQDLFDRVGLVSRIDVRLRSGANAAQVARSLALPAGLSSVDPAQSGSRSDSLSRAYRVNLTVLAMMALFTGAFLVYSVLSLSIVQRAPRFALLAVLGLTGRERMRLVLAEACVFGALASALGIVLGTALATLALRKLGADMGGGYFRDLAAPLFWQPWAALIYFALGLLAATLGAWWPARLAQNLPPAITLKGGGLGAGPARGPAAGLLLICAGALCAMLPPVFELPLGAYLGIGLLLTGGVLALPYGVARIYRLLVPHLSRRPLLLLAVERGRRMGHDAAMAVSAVVVSLSLAVALTVMVASFRNSVAHWLDLVLPADLYLRTAVTSLAGETAFLPPEVLATIVATPGVARVQATTLRPLQLRADRPAVVLLARPVRDAERELPLVGPLLKVPAGHIAVYVSEAMADLYGMRPGTVPERIEQALTVMPGARGLGNERLFVAGVLRDYVRQFGSLVIDRDAYQRLVDDQRVNDLALWLQPGTNEDQVRRVLREKLDSFGRNAASGAAPQFAGLVEMASTTQLRATSMRIFDRSFAVTYWLQAVAIGIGLFGVATSFSAQVLARRREFGLLTHVGLTRRQILSLVAAEGCAWTLIGALAGLVLGLGTGFILVEVVNPQSFHWTMDFVVPWARLLWLCLAVVVAGTFTAWLAGRSAASADAVMAVKEDW